MEVKKNIKEDLEKEKLSKVSYSDSKLLYNKLKNRLLGSELIEVLLLNDKKVVISLSKKNKEYNFVVEREVKKEDFKKEKIVGVSIVSKEVKK